MTKARATGTGGIYPIRGGNLWRATLAHGDGTSWSGHSKTREGAEAKLADHKLSIGWADPLPRVSRRDAETGARALGTHSRADLRALRSARPATCRYCEVSLNAYNESLDHKQSIYCGGSDAIENLQIICWECNIEKDILHADEFVYRGPLPRPWSVHPRRSHWLAQDYPDLQVG